ncbi:BnaA07g09890D [Brassica napus]|uniref:BnaA07g09890D protein n=1 Tax=Brassica napus TaxID=3708 RepID=A0A078GMG1_BRANA|nr:BnaA07g09890D [Brassica napus]
MKIHPSDSPSPSFLSLYIIRKYLTTSHFLNLSVAKFQISNTGGPLETKVPICLSAEVNAILNKNRASAAGHVSFSLNISFLLAPKVQNEYAMEQLFVTVKVLEGSRTDIPVR